MFYGLSILYCDEMNERDNWLWLKVNYRDKNPLMSLQYKFGFTMYRLNKSHKIREMIIWFWFMDCFVKNPWIHGTIHVIKPCVNKC